MQKLILRMPEATLNKYITAERNHPMLAANIKRQETSHIAWQIKSAMNRGAQSFDWPCGIRFIWHVKNRRQDPDNIAFMKKYILDGMQDVGFIPNDSMRFITGFADDFIADGKEIVEIMPIEKAEGDT